MFLAGGPILWASKLQPVTSLSSAEAEYYAASSCGAAVVAIRLYFSDLHAEPLMYTPVFIRMCGLCKEFQVVQTYEAH